MSKCFEAKGAGISDTEGSMRGWYSYPLFEGMECFPEDLGYGISATYFYPEPADLRERLAALEADPSPIMEAVNEWYSLPQEQGRDRCHLIPLVLQEMHAFVDCYEEAFANRTEFKPVCRRDFDAEDNEQKEIDSGRPPDANGPPVSEDGESFGGQSVEWGDPSLMVQACRYEKTPSGTHREPYIILW
jgi:hypothetical protein